MMTLTSRYAATAVDMYLWAGRSTVIAPAYAAATRHVNIVRPAAAVTTEPSSADSVPAAAAPLTRLLYRTKSYKAFAHLLSKETYVKQVSTLYIYI